MLPKTSRNQQHLLGGDVIMPCRALSLDPPMN
jgi:hypothetical protein